MFISLIINELIYVGSQLFNRKKNDGAAGIFIQSLNRSIILNPGTLMRALMAHCTPTALKTPHNGNLIRKAGIASSLRWRKVHTILAETVVLFQKLDHGPTFTNGYQYSNSAAIESMCSRSVFST